MADETNKPNAEALKAAEAKAKAEADAKTAAEAKAKADAEDKAAAEHLKHTEGLIKMHRGDSVIHAHPTTIKDHEKNGWKVA